MPLSDFTKKPKLQYRPETVLTPEPVITNSYIGDVDITGIEAEKLDIQSTIDYIEEEINNLSILQSAILNSISDEPVQVPEDLLESVGLKSISKTDYMSAISSRDSRNTIITDIYEEYHLDLTNIKSSPQCVVVSVLEELKDTLFSNVNLLKYEFEAAVDSVHMSSITMSKTHLRDITDILKLDVEKSKGIRKSIIRLAKIGAMDIQKSVIRYLLLGKSSGEANISRTTIGAFLSTLRAIRGSLMFYGTLYALDIKSLLSTIKGFLLNYFLDKAYNEVLQYYSKLRISIVKPVIDVVQGVSIPGTLTNKDSNTINSLTTILLGAVDALTEKYRLQMADFYRRKRRRFGLILNSTNKVKVMVLCKRWIVALDAAIAGIESALRTGTVEGWQIDEIQRVMNTKSTKSTASILEDNLVNQTNTDTDPSTLETIDHSIVFPNSKVSEHIEDDIVDQDSIYEELLYSKYNATKAKADVAEYEDILYSEMLNLDSEDTV